MKKLPQGYERLTDCEFERTKSPLQDQIVFILTQKGNLDNLTLKAHRALQLTDAVFTMKR